MLALLRFLRCPGPIHHGTDCGPNVPSVKCLPELNDRTSFAPETTSPKRNKRDRTQMKTQQNQRS